MESSCVSQKQIFNKHFKVSDEGLTNPGSVNNDSWAK